MIPAGAAAFSGVASRWFSAAALALAAVGESVVVIATSFLAPAARFLPAARAGAFAVFAAGLAATLAGATFVCATGAGTVSPGMSNPPLGWAFFADASALLTSLSGMMRELWDASATAWVRGA